MNICRLIFVDDTRIKSKLEPKRQRDRVLQEKILERSLKIFIQVSFSCKLLFLGHRSFTKNKTQTSVINMGNKRILFSFIKLRLFTVFITAVCVFFLLIFKDP